VEKFLEQVVHIFTTLLYMVKSSAADGILWSYKHYCPLFDRLWLLSLQVSQCVGATSLKNE